MLGAERAAGAVVLDDVLDERLAFSSRASASDVRLVFAEKIPQRGEDRVRRGAAEPADAALRGEAGEGAELVEVRRPAFAQADLVEDFIHPGCSDPAERALAARLVTQERQEIPGHIDHAVVLVEHDEPARSHDRARRRQRLEIDRRAGERRRDAATGRTPDLHGLEFFSVRHAAADVLDDFADRDPHRHLDEPRAVDLAGQREHFRALAFLRAERGECLGAMADDPRDHRERLDVVDQCRPLPQPAIGRIRRLHARDPALALDRFDKRRFLTAHECPGSLENMEGKIFQKPSLGQHADRLAQPAHRARIFGADIDIAFLGADAVRGDQHPLDDTIGK